LVLATGVWVVETASMPKTMTPPVLGEKLALAALACCPL
jgi:hypothetical protein